MALFGDLQAYREQPIPDLSVMRERKQNYRAHPIDGGSAQYDEPLVDLSALGIDGLNHYAHAANPPYYQAFNGAIKGLYARTDVVEKLLSIDRRLREQGLKLFLYDAYRPTEVQSYAHDVWMPAHLQKKHPDLTGDALMQEVEKYWAAPTVDLTRPSPHKTGGAVDLTIAYQTSGQALFMGSIFDDGGAVSHTDAFESRIGSGSSSDEEAIANRRLLYWLMRDAGFANHPFEWWHFSHGDQMWAKLTGAPAAFYGAAEL